MHVSKEDWPISLWDVTSAEPDLRGEMATSQIADVAIVGGGFTGLSTALHAAEAGLDSVVLEGGRIGSGGSGRNVGLVNAGLWLPPQDVRASLGEKRGANLVELLGRAPEYVFSLIEKHGIRCEPTRTGTIHAAHSPKGFADLSRRAQEWRRLGAPVDLLSPEEARSKIGSKGFHGGLLDRRAGTINPLAYARGLARAAIDAGARIFTDARVVSMEQVGEAWRLKTQHGSVTARRVVLATESYSDGLWPGMDRVLTRIHYFQLATRPLGSKVAGILDERQGVWDTGAIMFSIRKDAFDRLVVGSMGSIVGGATGLSRRWAETRLARLFPQLGPVEFEVAWHGRIGMTSDHLPRIHRLAEGVFAPIGYNGRGITPGTVFGKAMAEFLAGRPSESLPLPLTDLGPAGSSALRSKLFELAFTANQLLKSV